MLFGVLARVLVRVLVRVVLVLVRVVWALLEPRLLLPNLNLVHLDWRAGMIFAT